MEQRIELFPGVHLTAIQSDKFKTGCFSLNLVRPLCRQEAAMNALIPSVLLGGTRRYPDIRSISRALDNLYGATVGTLIRKKGETQLVGFYADYIEDELVGEPIFQKMAELLGELLFHPLTEEGAFLGRIFDGEKQKLTDAIEAVVNDKRAYATEQMLKTMCAGEPYGVPRTGDAADLKPVTARGLYEYYQKILAQSRLELFYMGRQSPRTAADIFANILQQLPRGRVDGAQSAPLFVQAHEKTVEKRLKLSQSKLSMGLRTERTNTIDTLARNMVMSVVFGGGPNSKLFRKVREEQSLCYYVGASFDKYKDVMIVSAGIDAGQRDAVKDEILRQLSLCAEGNITEQELEVAKRQLDAAFRSVMDSPASLDDFYIGQTVLGASYSVEELMQAVQRVTGEQVMAAAQAVKPDTVYFLRGEPEC